MKQKFKTIRLEKSEMAGGLRFNQTKGNTDQYWDEYLDESR